MTASMVASIVAPMAASVAAPVLGSMAVLDIQSSRNPLAPYWMICKQGTKLCNDTFIQQRPKEHLY